MTVICSESCEDLEKNWINPGISAHNIYGLTCAPYLAICTLHQLVNDKGLRYPRHSAALQRGVYVDNVFIGVEALEEDREIQRKLLETCNLNHAGDFPWKKWAANNENYSSPFQARIALSQILEQQSEGHLGFQ